MDLTDPTVRRVWGASLHKVLLRCHSPEPGGRMTMRFTGEE